MAENRYYCAECATARELPRTNIQTTGECDFCGKSALVYQSFTRGVHVPLDAPDAEGSPGVAVPKPDTDEPEPRVEDEEDEAEAEGGEPKSKHGKHAAKKK